MTREEAIEILEEVKVLDDSMYQFNPKYMESLDMAIKALQTKPCDDAISRQAAFNLCKRFSGYVPYAALSNYDMLPPVQPEQKVGKWLGTDDWYHKCSNCGEVFHFYYKDKHKWRYCPSCKTNMEEGE